MQQFFHLTIRRYNIRGGITQSGQKSLLSAPQGTATARGSASGV